MFSYRHAFHAGNHADVLKHSILIQLLQYLRRKETPFWYLDTHAGAGTYDLSGAWANKTGEFAGGIERLWDAPDLPPMLAEYIAVVKGMNPEGPLTRYPGSPWLAFDLLGPRDKLRLFEMHPTEAGVLAENLRRRGRTDARKFMLYATDGFVGLKALLPPPPRRGVILIDPSYEDKNDYRRALIAVREGLERFSTGCYAVWYPQVQRREAQLLAEKLERLQVKSWLHATLTVAAPSASGVGLHGSGMFIINPPYTLRDQLARTLPYLAKTLGIDGAGTYALRHAG